MNGVGVAELSHPPSVLPETGQLRFGWEPSGKLSDEIIEGREDTCVVGTLTVYLTSFQTSPGKTFSNRVSQS